MSREYVIFEQTYSEIPKQDLPINNILIWRGVGGTYWKVSLVKNDATMTVLGMFFKLDMAESFAKALCKED